MKRIKGCGKIKDSTTGHNIVSKGCRDCLDLEYLYYERRKMINNLKTINEGGAFNTTIKTLEGLEDIETF